MHTQVENALRSIGFEVRTVPGTPVIHGGASVYKGTAPVEPAFGFVGAFELTTVVHLNGERKEGNFLVCLEPGTGNLQQVFDLKDGGKYLSR